MSARNGSRVVLIDDNDPSITFVGDWAVTDDQFGPINAWGPPIYGSQHATNSNGSFFFPFRGSNIIVSGTMSQVNDTEDMDPSWDCSVDGVSYGHYTSFINFPVNKWPLCIINLDTDGQHILNVTTTSRRNSTFYLDAIRYVPTPNLTENFHPTVLISHTDGAIRYVEGNWLLYSNSSMLTQSINSKLQVEFNGTRVTWFGRVPEDYPLGDSTATYSIDGRTPVEFTVPSYPGDSANTTLFFQVLFETPTLSRGAHSLEVVHHGPAAPLVLDYLLVDNGDITYNINSGPSLAGPEGLDPTSTNPGSNSPSQPVSSADRPDPPTGAIVGGVVGGLAFIGMIAGLFYFFVWRDRSNERNRNSTHPSSSAVYSTSPGHEPKLQSTPPVFYSPQNQHQQLVYPKPSTTGTSATDTLVSNPGLVSNIPSYHTQATNPTLGGAWSQPTANRTSMYAPGIPQYHGTTPNYGPNTPQTHYSSQSADMSDTTFNPYMFTDGSDANRNFPR
ncbi:hypothetical protein FA15DRAFT_756932 [Coprinopsis marcescibilis]|uniref:Transmembrane protein n=1 Tax=Coprinopsis marcescibilis TaxID=230819 RepID=A0A5C3KVI3_COPMA|nr:hypothetical protein FA15DRAFT_756932 [Coprinopsis marcescibilis]